MKQMSHKAWGNKKEEMRLWHLLYEALTETILTQLIMLLYPQPNSMLYPRGTDCNIFSFYVLMKLNQYLQFSNHIYCDYFLVRTNNNLIPVINCNEKWFMRRSPLEHFDSNFISWCFHIVFIVHKSCCYFFSEVRILFSSRSKQLIVGRWWEYSCLGRGFDKFHVFEKIIDLLINETQTLCQG